MCVLSFDEMEGSFTVDRAPKMVFGNMFFLIAKGHTEVNSQVIGRNHKSKVHAFLFLPQSVNYFE